MSKTKVINIYGAPCSGKSTLAMRLAADMKVKGFKVEYVEEYAKGQTYENNFCNLSDQILIFGEQQHLQYRVRDKVDWIVTDSPFPMGITYLKNPYKELENLIWKEYDNYENYNFYLPPIFEYQSHGRRQNQEEAYAKGIEIQKLLDDNNINYTIITEHKLKKRVRAILNKIKE
jgi:nicotinamide riboside kinase